MLNVRGSGRTDGGDDAVEATAPDDVVVVDVAESEPDEGTRVSRLSYGRHLRVLLVDGDDEQAAAFLAAAEEAVLDVQVEVATDIDDALARLDRASGQRRRRAPDIVVSALAVPDSHDLLHQLRDDERFGVIPVLVLSAESSASLERRSFALGAAGHLRAPRVAYERVALVHALPDFIPNARAALAQMEYGR